MRADPACRSSLKSRASCFVDSSDFSNCYLKQNQQSLQSLGPSLILSSPASKKHGRGPPQHSLTRASVALGYLLPSHRAVGTCHIWFQWCLCGDLPEISAAVLFPYKHFSSKSSVSDIPFPAGFNVGLSLLSFLCSSYSLAWLKTVVSETQLASILTGLLGTVWWPHRSHSRRE